MKIDIDQSNLTDPPWDLTLTIKGIDYPVRQVSLGEYAQLNRQAGTLSPEQELEILGGLFAGPTDGNRRPPLAELSPDQRFTVGAAIGAYLMAWLGKKRQAILARVTAGMAGSISG
jgi:hypothetical protein